MANRTVVLKASEGRPGGEGEEEELEEDDIGCGTCGAEDCYEAKIGNDFLTEHQGHGPPKPPTDGCFLCLKGPLAQLNWDSVLFHIQVARPLATYHSIESGDLRMQYWNIGNACSG